MTTPLPPETSRRIEEIAKDIAENYALFSFELATQKMKSLLTELAQSQGEGKLAPPAGETPICDSEGFEIFTKEFGNTEVLLLDSARQLESQLSALKAELEEAKRANEWHAKAEAAADREADRLRSELEQARADLAASDQQQTTLAETIRQLKQEKKDE